MTSAPAGGDPSAGAVPAGTVPAGTPSADDLLGLIARSHPMRSSLSEEMHLRQLPRFAAPARLLQVVMLLGEGGAPASHAHAAALCAARGQTLAPDAKHAALEAGGLELVWERHTEFASYTFLLPGAFAAPFEPGAFAALHAVIADMPGEVIRATQIALLPRGAPEPDPASLAANFRTDALVCCDVADGKARIWSDFILGGDGLGRLLIVDQGLEGDEPTRLVQQIQELGNYRNMALLGLPVAQRLTPEVSRLEQRLASLTQRVAEPQAADEPLLEELSYLSAELARLLADTRYRMSATRAYAQISADRLDGLGVIALPGYQTLADFTDRRLVPAVRTCGSFSQRLEDLSQRTAWASSLLRTRIDTALARQNRDLLDSMDRRTRLQLRLQQAVEGLSVVAISYYLVALLGDVVKPWAGHDHELVMAIAAPIVVAGVALLLWRMKRRLKE